MKRFAYNRLKGKHLNPCFYCNRASCGYEIDKLTFQEAWICEQCISTRKSLKIRKAKGIYLNKSKVLNLTLNSLVKNQQIGVLL